MTFRNARTNTIYYSIAEAAKILHYHPVYLQNLCRIGKMKCIRRKNRSYGISEAELQKWLDEVYIDDEEN